MQIALGLSIPAVAVRAPPGTGTPTPDPDPEIPAITLTQTSTPGRQLTVSALIHAYAIGYYLRIQVASNGGFTTALSGEGAIRDDYRILTSDDFVDGDGDGYVELVGGHPSLTPSFPNGATYMRWALGVDDGEDILWGDWSNTINDTVSVEAESTFDQVNKHAQITVTAPANVVAATNVFNVGQTGIARVTNARSGKRCFAVRITAHPDAAQAYRVGVMSSALNPTTGGLTPGATATPNGAFISAAANLFINNANAATGLGAAVLNNYLLFAFDSATKEVWAGRNAGWESGKVPGVNAGRVIPATMADFFAFWSGTIKTGDSRGGEFISDIRDIGLELPPGFLPYDDN